ncbi:Oxa1 family cytochrome oxidase biogenesis protein [Ligilactobacillus hayakitensis DSM 18933 = JCM 14209]|uniref:Oxa1 family cytochrome oxidase biogenesis protein n=1 Tax=Ligilactobacillus hayakitensis DSM 18933 = JCM 14209 TaxID=1423755 RepID=A0A0R1WLS0_9LACO|nr:membrane protein insertase YidC [Ligilactobacillus hayakitensis]KRM18766.1 Oxa1 family cytochrome oxidase biogenesis protein [Ligilactobacillus hayakitensis DSM 18933 = JCM 14209]
MKKKNQLAISFALIALLLSGCVQRTKSGKPYGFVYEKLAIPTQHILNWLAEILGGSYGWSIIVITFIVRLILMPIMIKQSKNATIQQEKISLIRPQLNKLQERQKEAKTPEEQAAVSQAMMKLYRENNISMTGGIGCLPLLIQMPIFAALYAAIQYSPELAKSYFMGINLGQRSFAFVLLTFISYALQGYLSTLGLPEEQKKQMQSMMIISPLMITVMTYVSPAGLGLYFFIGGIFACIQTLIINFMRPRIRQEMQNELKNKPVFEVELPSKTEEETTNSSESKTNAELIHQNNRKRNAGKQKNR